MKKRLIPSAHLSPSHAPPENNCATSSPPPAQSNTTPATMLQTPSSTEPVTNGDISSEERGKTLAKHIFETVMEQYPLDDQWSGKHEKVRHVTQPRHVRGGPRVWGERG